MKLLEDRIKVKILPEEELDKNGLYIAPNPITGKRLNYNRCEVIEVGVGRTNKYGKVIPMTVKKGDILICPFIQTSTFRDENNEEYQIIYETEVWGIEE